MFDLEQHIRAWRQAQADALPGRPEAIAELESHLRDEVQRLVDAGQTVAAAWPLALSRLGQPAELAVEFAKLPPPAPAFWWPARLTLFAPIPLGVALAALLAARIAAGMDLLLAAHVFTVTLGYSVTFAVGALAVCSILTRALRGWDAHRAAALRAVVCKLTMAGLALTAIGVALGGVWAREHWGRLWGWDLVEIGGLSVLTWYTVMLVCLRAGAAGERAGMLLGVAGNVVVSLSWFGPRLAEHFTAAAWILVAFVTAQIVLFAVAFVPAGRLARRHG
jgi:hypothetical protein